MTALLMIIRADDAAGSGHEQFEFCGCAMGGSTSEAAVATLPE